MSTELDTPQIPKQKTGLDRPLAQRLVDDYLRLLVAR